MTRSRGNHKPPIRNLSTYWERTHWPLQALYFLLPLIVLYEIGVARYARPQGIDISARLLLRAMFEWAGVTGYYLPGLIVIVVLLSWHFVRRDPWRPEPKLYGLMWLEAIVLMAPLFVFSLVLFRQPVMPMASEVSLSAVSGLLAQAGGADQPPWQAELVFPIGAGIYEEMLFRVIVIAMLHLLLVDLLALPEQYGAGGAVVLSAVAFALYHFQEPNPLHWHAFWEGFDAGRFFFYTIAGVYFASIYLLRGFGIVVAVHALYDVLLVVVNWPD